MFIKTVSGPKCMGERRDQLKDALIDAAEGIIARDGLVALRARDIAAKAGCALGAIYTAFSDLDSIVIAVNMRTLALLDRCLRSASDAKSMKADAKSENPDVVRLIRLALAYLDFAGKHSPRWRALFEHRLPDDQPVPTWYQSEQNRIFAFVEEPLRGIRPGLTASELALLARTVFAAVHGIISLGLEEKLGEMTARRLRDQTTLVVTAIARGLGSRAPAVAAE
jgi:AcrR family transcriptional regulator